MGVISRLNLRQFRNYASLNAAFRPGINVLLGENGQGKTNLLEGIYFLSLLRSFRTTQISDLCRWRERSFIVAGELIGEETLRLGVEYGERRRWRVNGESVARASDFIGRFHCAAFAPEDLALIQGPGGGRRRFLDMTLSQLYPEYLGALQEYQKVLKSRASLLRQRQNAATQLKAFDSVLVTKGAILNRFRDEFFAEFRPALQAVGREYYPADLTLDLQLLLSVRRSKAVLTQVEYEIDFTDALQQSRERDLERQQTHMGPHRDDFGLTLTGKDLSRFGSEGQCRLGALALKTAVADMLLNRPRSKAVILLVDDVIGELDTRGRRAFFGSLRRADQVFLACTDNSLLNLLEVALVQEVHAGKLQSQPSSSPPPEALPEA
jgi:DNA replication and repair protein RecF